MIQRDVALYLDKRLGTHYGKGPEYLWPCPVCIDRKGSESKKRKLSVNLARGLGRCWRCDYRFGSLATLFREINGGALRSEEIALLNRHRAQLPPLAGLRSELRRTFAPPSVVPDAQLRPVRLPREAVRLLAHPMGSPRTAPAWAYLRRRGLGVAQVRAFDIHYCVSGEYGGRLVFPVVQRGQQVFFVTRAISKWGPKSKNAPNQEGYCTPATCLLNYDAVVGQPVVAVVEGPFDCMAHQHAVSLHGKSLSDQQLQLLRELVAQGLEEVVVSLDADAGRVADSTYHRLLLSVPKVTVLALDVGDPHDRRAELPKLLQHRKELDVSMRARLRLPGK